MNNRRNGRNALFALVFLLAIPSWAAERTLWLVRPLYPGQDALVARTEQTLGRLLPKATRADDVVGMKELSLSLRGRTLDAVPCLTDGSRCQDPIDQLVSKLGFSSVVLMVGGQDEAGYKFNVTCVHLATHEKIPASSSSPQFEKALLGAIGKVVPVTGELAVSSTPSGAAVYVDDIKVGLTPIVVQVLPGERNVKIDLKLHQPAEEAVVIPIRGKASVDQILEKVAARLVVTVSPVGTRIELDGKEVAKDRFDHGVQPGPHLLRLTAPGRKAFETTLSVKADEQVILDRVLEPAEGAIALPATVSTKKPVETAVQKPIEVQEKKPTVVETPLPMTDALYARGFYMQLGAERQSLRGAGLVGYRIGAESTGRTEKILSSQRGLWGAEFELGYLGRHFGLEILGMAGLWSGGSWDFSIDFAQGKSPELQKGMSRLETQIRVQLYTLKILQPQFRWIFGRFMVGAQFGAQLRSGLLTETTEPQFYQVGFIPIDIFLEGRLNVRFYPVAGFYLYSAYSYAHLIWGVTTNSDVHTADHMSFNLGVGNAF